MILVTLDKERYSKEGIRCGNGLMGGNREVHGLSPMRSLFIVEVCEGGIERGSFQSLEKKCLVKRV